MNKRKYLTEDELVVVEHTLSRYRLRDVRNVLMIDLLLYSGLRAGELLSIRKSDLQANRLLLVKTTKMGQERELPLRQDIYERLVEYAKDKSWNEYLFPISYNRLGDIWRYYSPIRKKLHSLRHTFAIQLYNKTRDIRLVQKALGHKYLSTTLIYSDYCDYAQDLRKAMCGG